WRRRGSVKVPTPLVLLLAGVAHAHGPPALALTDAQQRAAGVRVDHPVAMANVPQVEAYGLVLDPAALVTDMGRMESTQAAWHAAQADVVRVAGLYRDNLNASLKSLQLAQAQESETGAQARAAAAAFALQWGPVAALGAEKRHALLDALGAHVRVLLERAPVKGLLVPAVALLYGENGAYVYRDARRDPGDKHHYEAAAVQLLAAMGDSWLVSGLNASDAIVVQGAGVLWSLPGLSSFHAAAA